jgi:serine/threonine protein kinase
MNKIALSRGVWLYDPAKQLGQAGGFGAVFEGFSNEYGPLAVKRLHLSANDAAHREMSIATDLRDRILTHVIPVLDAGEDADSGAYFVVMPRADRSLQSQIAAGAFSASDAARVMFEIASGLLEVNDIVHRDLKPANILYHEGRWKIADFGIARFLEESTSLETLKGCLSPPYAAPEQWQYIRATSATDVYALGCIGYALVTGQPPFRAGGEEDFREQHLHADPPKLPASCPPRLQTLLSMMLRKPPSARPTLERLSSILQDVLQAPPASTKAAGFGVLAEAGAHVARVQAEAQRAQKQELSETEARNQLADTGRKILADIIERMLERICSEAPNAERRGFAVTLGQGQFEISLSGAHGHRTKGAVPADAFRQSKWDVVAAEEIVVHQQRPQYQWSASLWYCRLPTQAEYRWYEVSYFSPWKGEAAAPYSLTRRTDDADLAVSPVTHVYQTAFGPVAVDDEDEGDFIERWAALLGLASQGRLGHPRGLPLPPKFWRQPFVA